MANTRELRRRIKSVKNISQITKAMQMVAATKMRRAQSQALNGRPYSLNINQALLTVLPLVKNTHSLMAANNSDKKGVVLLSTDKSLCGALNTNIFRTILSSDLLGGDVIYYTVGKKGRNFVARAGYQLVADFDNLDTVTFRQAVQLARLSIEAFLAGEIGQAFLVYPHFGSTLRQEPTIAKFLPIDLESITLEVEDNEKAKQLTNNFLKDYLFEPNLDGLLDFLLNHFIQMKIYQSLLETKASEHSARMIAMQNATDNAVELVSDLNLTYNQTRQDSITKELLEITTAAMAMG